MILLGLPLWGLFVWYKLPALAPFWTRPVLQQVLTVMGYSYFFLRVLELVRANAEHRHPSGSLVDTLNDLLPFHMLAAGPIQSYDDFYQGHRKMPPLDQEAALSAIERIVWGLFKKFVLAYLIQEALLTGFSSSGLYLFLEIQIFFVWLYVDFSAYSDIAVGCGSLMGIATPENFNKPYMARNIIDFWERWHITLSQFIRANIFIPIQLFLIRKVPHRPLLAASIAFTIAFLLCGAWHNLDLRYVSWGAFHAGGLVVCNAYKSILKKRLGAAGLKAYMQQKSIRVVATVVTYEFVACSLYLIARPHHG